MGNRLYAQDGKALFQSNCASCHNPIKVITGPALKGVTERVPDKKLLHDWIRNNAKVLASGNPYFTGLFNQYNKTTMNTFPTITDGEIDAILKYVESYQAPVASTGGTGEDASSKGAQSDNTLLYGILTLILAMIIGKHLPGRSIFRTIYFMPYILSDVVTGVIWIFIYQPTGLLTMILSHFMSPDRIPLFLADPNVVLYYVFITMCWKYFGLNLVLYVAAIQNIPENGGVRGFSGSRKLQIDFVEILLGMVKKNQEARVAESKSLHQRRANATSRSCAEDGLASVGCAEQRCVRGRVQFATQLLVRTVENSRVKGQCC